MSSFATELATPVVTDVRYGHFTVFSFGLATDSKAIAWVGGV